MRELALVESADVALKPGLNLLTGETGSGKSLIIDALGLTLGERAQTDQVRHGADRALAEASFDISGNPHAAEAIRALGQDVDEQVVLSREVGKRSAARMNGRPVAPGQLRELAASLVALQGQAGTGSHHPLRDSEQQGLLLDSYAGLLRLRGDVAEAYAGWSAARQHLEELVRLKARGEREQEYLRWQLEELRGATLRPGEEDDLQAERAVVRHATRLRELAGEAGAALGGDEGVGLASVRMRAASELDPRLAAIAGRIEAAEQELADVAADVRRYVEQLEADPGRLEEIEARLSVLEGIKRKYGGSLEAALDERARLEAQLAQAENLDGSIADAEQRVESSRRSLEEIAAELTEKRSAAAQGMGAEVTTELGQLRLEGARFEVELRAREIGSDGAEDVEMLFSANPGEPLAPVQRVASGGELARLMLAIRTIGSDADGVPTLIFDEVDAGIGGEAAVMVGKRLKQLARSRQVVVVTHLPQIASFADHHLVVEKAPGADGRNVVLVRELKEAEERAEELARMMSGSVTDKALARAHELLEEAATLE